MKPGDQHPVDQELRVTSFLGYQRGMATILPYGTASDQVINSFRGEYLSTCFMDKQSQLQMCILLTHKWQIPSLVLRPRPTFRRLQFACGENLGRRLADCLMFEIEGQK